VSYVVTKHTTVDAQSRSQRMIMRPPLAVWHGDGVTAM